MLPKGLNIGLVDGTVDIPGIGKILDLKVLARALKSRGGTNVLSTPNLLTLDNESASIMVGQTIPFVSGQYVTDGGGTSNNPFQTIQREDVGLKLNIRPQISEGGTVKLDVYQEVSSVDERASTAAGVVTNKRAIDTSILLDDGQIMVLGGLLQDNVQDNTDGVPGLSSLPGVGSLFRYQKRSRTKTNLMVFLRPYIVRDAAAGRSITLNRRLHPPRPAARAAAPRLERRRHAGSGAAAGAAGHPAGRLRLTPEPAAAARYRWARRRRYEPAALRLGQGAARLAAAGRAWRDPAGQPAHARLGDQRGAPAA